MSFLLTFSHFLRARPLRDACFHSSAIRLAETPATFNGINTVELSYEVVKPPTFNESAQPIIFMHGLFGSKRNNRTISKALSRDLKRPIYNLDLRNHGDSPHNPRHDYLALAADVFAFIQSKNLTQPTVIGHSMGAKTAMTLALAAPTLIADVIPVDNSPCDRALGSDFSKYVAVMQQIERAKCKSRAEADKIMEPYEPSLPIRQFLLQNLFRPENGAPFQFKNPLNVIAKSLNHMGDFPFKFPAEARYSRPTLFIRGTRSTYIPDELIPVIGDFFPTFRLVDIESGHWVISEKPHEFKEAVIDFLNRKE